MKGTGQRWWLGRRGRAAGEGSATAALVCQAIDRFQAWKFEAGEELLERALEARKHEYDDNIAERERGRPARTPSSHPAAV